MKWLVNTQKPRTDPYWIIADFKRCKRSYGVYRFTELVDKDTLIQFPKNDWGVVHDKLPWEFLE